MPSVGLPATWSDAAAAAPPAAFVGHQHLAATERLVRWIAAHDVTILTTIRHPGDALLFSFHYARWQEVSQDPSFGQLRSDGTAPGQAALRFATGGFAQAHAISLAWASLGAEVVRYEDLVQDPVSRLGALGARISRLPECAAWRAAVLCQTTFMTLSGLVDPRHIRPGRAGGWQAELSDDFVEAMAGIVPFRSACATYNYQWD